MSCAIRVRINFDYAEVNGFTLNSQVQSPLSSRGKSQPRQVNSGPRGASLKMFDGWVVRLLKNEPDRTFSPRFQGFKVRDVSDKGRRLACDGCLVFVEYFVAVGPNRDLR